MPRTGIHTNGEWEKLFESLLGIKDGKSMQNASVDAGCPRIPFILIYPIG
jgi:hypothetical protein